MIAKIGQGEAVIQKKRLGLSSWPALLYSAALLSGVTPALAQSDPDRAALLDRIQMLERRLEQLERGRASAPPRAARGPLTAAPSAPRVVPLPRSAIEPGPATAVMESPTTGRALQAAAPDISRSRARDPQDEEIPQEAFVFRDQAVTLRPGRAEVSFDVNYARDRRTVTNDRSVAGILAGRVGVYDGIEASLTLPVFQSTRTFEMGPNNLSDREKRGLGDLSAQLNVRGWGERPLWPGAVFTLAGIAPTGPTPFLNPIRGLNDQQVPVDITQLVASRGVWAVRGGVQFFKTVDPLVLFAGVSYEHAFPTEQYGITFRPGNRINYNAGMSFALSDRSTLGLTFIGSYTKALGANDIRYRSTATETGLMRFSLVQRIARSMWLEPSLAIGLVQESPNMQIGLGLRYRF